ncbi:MAG: GAF domain-containing protein, partial [Actinomycetota bacterium]
ILDAEGCSIALVEGDELVFHVVVGGAEREVTGMRMPIGQGIAGWALASGQPVAIQDVSRDPRFARDVADRVGYAPSAILAMPMETERAALGVIEVLDPRRGEAGMGNDLELLGVFARQAALAIETQRSSSQLAGVLLAALARAAEGADLRAALEAVRDDGDREEADLAELAARFAELGRLGARERRVALRLLEDFLSYARSTGSTG